MTINFQGLYIDRDLIGKYRAEHAAKMAANKPAASTGAVHVNSGASTLISAAKATTECISFSALWKAICNFFSSKSKTPTDIPSMEKRLGEIAQRDKFIWFYDDKTNPLTSFLGNFHPCKVKVWGLTFACSEAAFQAAKFFPNKKLMARFCKLDGDGAFQLAKQMTSTWSTAKWDAWQKRNLKVMGDVVYAKFTQNPDLKRLLLATKSASLVEHTARDSFWGNGGNGSGKNELGKTLMWIRMNLGGNGLMNPPGGYTKRILGG